MKPSMAGKLLEHASERKEEIIKMISHLIRLEKLYMLQIHDLYSY